MSLLINLSNSTVSKIVSIFFSFSLIMRTMNFTRSVSPSNMNTSKMRIACSGGRSYTNRVMKREEKEAATPRLIVYVRCFKTFGAFFFSFYSISSKSFTSFGVSSEKISLH